jgi:hypothetical protein
VTQFQNFVISWLITSRLGETLWCFLQVLHEEKTCNISETLSPKLGVGLEVENHLVSY